MSYTNKKIATLTLGCKVNQYETDAMHQLLEASGYQIVDFNDGADVYIVNTCSVTNMADRKSRQMLHRAKKKNQNAVIVAVGCYVQAAKEQLLEDPYVDLVVGNNKKKDIVAILNDYWDEKEADEPVIEIGKTNEFEELSIAHVNEHTRVYIKVQDGCNQFCSYCIIPFTRGRARSRKKEDILNEVQTLAGNGYQEVILTGIHLSSYGIDLENTSLLDLILEVSKIDGVKRIRLGSLEPRIITKEFVKQLINVENFCPHFHLSLQSGCDETLKRMNRKYTTAEYEEACEILRTYFVDPAITTDVIVGFPGETEEEFATTVDFLKRIKLYEMHVFKYSIRKGTRAEQMPDQVPDSKKAERSSVLLKLNQENKKEFEKKFQNEKVDILVEEEIEIDGISYWTGHTKRYQKAAFLSDKNCINQIISAEITGRIKEDILLGKIE